MGVKSSSKDYVIFILKISVHQGGLKVTLYCIHDIPRLVTVT